jgi:hypothetical protein
MDARAAIKNGFADGELYIDEKEQRTPTNLSFTKIRALNSYAPSVEKLEALEKPPETDNLLLIAKAKMNLAAKL